MPIELVFAPLPSNSNPDAPYIKGLPGLSSFTILGTLKITNDSKSGKPVTLKSLDISFKGTSRSVINFAHGGFDGFMNSVAIGTGEGEASIPKHVDHVKVKQVGVLRGSKELAAGASVDFSFSMDVLGPAEGGPSYLPPSVYNKKGHIAETFYELRADYVVSKKGMMGSSTEPKHFEFGVPFRSFDLRFGPVVYHLIGADPLPAPGWISGTPQNLPPTATFKGDRTFLGGDWGDISFPQGLVIQRGQPLPITTKFSSVITSVEVQITQYFNIFNRSMNAEVAISSTRTAAQENNVFVTTFTATHSQQITQQIAGWTENVVLTTQPMKRADIKCPFQISHFLKLKLNISNGKPIELTTPVIIFDLGKEHLGSLPTDLIMEAASSVKYSEVEHVRGYLDYPLSPCTIKPPNVVGPARPVTATSAVDPNAKPYKKKGFMDKLVDKIDRFGWAVTTEGDGGPNGGKSSLVGGRFVKSFDVVLDHPNNTFYPSASTHITGYLELVLADHLEGASDIVVSLVRLDPHPKLKNGTVDVELDGDDTTIWVHPKGWNEKQVLSAGVHQYPFKLEWKEHFGVGREVQRFALRCRLYRKPTSLPPVNNRKNFYVHSGEAPGSGPSGEALPAYGGVGGNGVGGMAGAVPEKP
ncbi:hypothetical protein HK097_010372 [Rhizophlyctis rosea]|uniref:Uncharacterized protein n=1 Tax=Rhizophlyctis rosea TaxID=64517 RepID=A0AAD5S7N3_9FUNG|nr:hypothetical protein HK097_010372 [Rhizophlyctis rosea]